MTRAFHDIGTLLTLLLLWATFVFPQSPFRATGKFFDVLIVLPLYSLVSFGCYSLAQISWNLLAFREVPEAYISLLKEIDQAKKELSTKDPTLVR
mmetsp:Transcript_29309/g.47310  ORF Transcript_29309/g.47310 Transcript_29309/m.47310 type:complete len:95 (-) Transcript_29309:116-400(-)